MQYYISVVNVVKFPFSINSILDVIITFSGERALLKYHEGLLSHWKGCSNTTASSHCVTKFDYTGIDLKRSHNVSIIIILKYKWFNRTGILLFTNKDTWRPEYKGPTI
jgi:hypothetical protein